MYLQESLLPDWESAPKRSKGGSKTGRLKASSPKEGKEDITSIQLSLFDGAIPQMNEPHFYMPEFQVAVRKTIYLNRLSFFSLVTPTQKSSLTSEVDSISNEKVFKPYWTEFSQTLANLLSLPTKIGFVALGSILSHGSVLDSRLRYWFSTKRTSAQNARWSKIFLPLSMSSVADCTGLESTKNKSLKTVSYRVYPVKELELIWKRWVSAVRKVYNISIAYLNENQGFVKVGKKGGKMGFRTMLKASGLIPQWCLDLNVSKILDNASMEAYKAWSETDKNPQTKGTGKDKKPHPQAGLKIAKFRSIRDQKLTIQFDPSAYKNGRWMVSTTKHLPHPEFRGQDFCILTDGSSELTYNKRRWFAHLRVEFEQTMSVTNKVIALDPGVRTFMTGFDGSDFWEFGNGDFNKIAKLCSHLDKLKSRHDLCVGHQFKRLRYKIRFSMEKLRTRIKNLRSECHKQVGSYLAKNYDVIVLPTFETSQMVVKKKRKLKNKTARAMMTWAFYQFSQTLEHLCNRYGSKLVRITEEYTSKTCTKCGHVHRKLGSSKNFICPDCGYEIPRDFNGAVGIFLKAMWDTTFTDSVGDVVLDIHDISNVGECLG
jgi:putative transposase